MTRDEALAQLAPAHALALALDESDASSRVIADALHVDESAVAPLVEVATRKLARLVASDRPD